MALVITTTSSTQYMSDKDNAIYPPFVDNLAYEVWAGPHPAVRQSYFQLRATGGTTYTWSVSSGSLPPGMELLPDGKLQGSQATKGKVTQEGTFTFVVSCNSGTETVQKELTIRAEPYRGNKIDNAKFGFVCHWGRMSEISLTDVLTSDAAFRARATEFSAQAWVSEIKRLGGKALHFSSIWQDSFRNWPSTTPSRLNLFSQRDWVGELIAECHAQDVLFYTYFCPDYFFNPINITDGSLATNAWGSLNIGLIAELVAKGVDGFWFDVGAAPELYSSVNPAWLYFYEDVLPRIRRQNPYCTIAVNPGIVMGGVPVKYPDLDILIYEGYPNSVSLDTLETARPNVLEKKMGMEVDSMLSRHWGYGPGAPTDGTKDPKGFIEHIKVNWALGNTVMMALPIRADGLFLSPIFADAVNEIGAFVAANQGYSVAPVLTYANGHVTITAPNNARTYYTLNGELPTKKNSIYVAPIKVSVGTEIQAISSQPNLPNSKPVRLIVPIDEPNTVEGFKKLITAEPIGNVNAKEPAGYYRGMRITVARSPIVINKVGRREVTPMTTEHTVQIRRYHDHWPIFVGTIKTTDPVIDGYRYIDLPNIPLEAGMGYLVMSKENNTDDYASNVFSEVPITEGARIVKNAVYSVFGEKAPVVVNTTGQFLNLFYKTVPHQASSNLLRGKPSEYRSLGGTLLIPSGGKGFPENSVDGSFQDRSQPAGSYNFEQFFDLRKMRKISKIKMNFHQEAFSTNFTIYASTDKIERIPIASRVGNTEVSFLFEFAPLTTRWIIVRSNSPSAPGQLGYQMNIVEIEAY